jgi:hypothetical protein
MKWESKEKKIKEWKVKQYKSSVDKSFEGFKELGFRNSFVSIVSIFIDCYNERFYFLNLYFLLSLKALKSVLKEFLYADDI